jgi:tRNA pseudouridine(38-40) synthase
MGSNFHNYTIGKPFNDRSVKRFMITIDVSEPTLYGDIEWISVKIHGQSFMLHQIVCHPLGSANLADRSAKDDVLGHVGLPNKYS